MNNTLLEALNQLEGEKRIDKEAIFTAIESALVSACKTHYKDVENVTAAVDNETGDFHVFLVKTVVEEVNNPFQEISLEDAQAIDGHFVIGDSVNIGVDSTAFGRIAMGKARSTIIQTIRTEERKNIYREFLAKEHTVVTGIVQRKLNNNNIAINLGTTDAFLPENEQVFGEHLKPMDRIKVYIFEVKETTKGTKIRVSRTHPELVKQLFEQEVTEIREGIVEIKSIAREPGNRTKMAVWTNDEDLDPIGACVGMNGSRVNAIVDELRGEKIDIITWSETPAFLIENALSPAKVISVIADSAEKSAKVVVPDFQLSLAIGKEGQNARLAARLTGYKIDIKSETQARELGDFLPYDEEYDDDDEYYDEEEYYDENGENLEGTEVEPTNDTTEETTESI